MMLFRVYSVEEMNHGAAVRLSQIDIYPQIGYAYLWLVGEEAKQLQEGQIYELTFKAVEGVTDARS